MATSNITSPQNLIIPGNLGYNFVIPPQSRLIDPYSFIFENNQINRQWDLIFGINQPVIVNGLTIQLVNNQQITIAAGSCIIDHVYIEIEQTNVSLTNTSYTAGVTNYIIIRYSYALVFPQNNAFIDITTNVSDNDLILGFASINSAGNILQISSTNGTENISPTIWQNIQSNLASGSVNNAINIGANLSLNNNMIVNVGNPVSSNDLVNNEYTNSIDGKVSISSIDQTNDYLINKLVGGDNIGIQENTSNQLVISFTSADPSVYQKMVTSADSGLNFLGV